MFQTTNQTSTDMLNKMKPRVISRRLLMEVAIHVDLSPWPVSQMQDSCRKSNTSQVPRTWLIIDILSACFGSSHETN